MLSGFGYNTLYGIIIQLVSWDGWGDDPNLLRVFKILESQATSLKILVLQGTKKDVFKLPSEAVSSISKLTKLEWLYVEYLIPEASDLANLKVLSQLKVLAARGLKNCDALLDKLRDNHNLHRLCLARSHVTEKNFEALSKLRSLRILDLHENYSSLQPSSSSVDLLWQKLSDLPNLKELCVDQNLLPAAPPSLARMKKLRTLIISGRSTMASVLPNVQAMLPKCRISVGGAKEADAWCSPLETNPKEEEL
jgi:hypothetical protein